MSHTVRAMLGGLVTDGPQDPTVSPTLAAVPERASLRRLSTGPQGNLRRDGTWHGTVNLRCIRALREAP